MSSLAMLSGASAILILSSIIYGMHWKSIALSERVKVVSLVSEVESAKTAIDTMKDLLKNQVKVTNTILDINAKSAETNDVYRKKLMEADRRTNKAVKALEALAKTEHKDALEQPYERGNSANMRITSILCRAWGPWANDNPRCTNTENNGNAETYDRE